MILNSGMGTRMGEETREHPKCMTVLSGCETILSKQLDQLYRMGVEEVIMTTGYLSDVLVDYCMNISYRPHVTYVKNEKYDSTNYIYSIYQARQYLKDDIILLHGDLVFDDSVLEDIIECKESCMTVDFNARLPQKDFKAVIKDNRILQIGIEFFEQAVAAQPLYKILYKDWTVWLREIEMFCERGEINCYAEKAYNRIAEQCRIVPLDVGGRLCREIDTIEDWKDIMEEVV